MPSNPTNKIPTIEFEVNEINTKSDSRVRINVAQSFHHKVGETLKPYKNVPKLFRPALEQIGDYVRINMIPRTFNSEGPGWAPLSQRTITDKRRLGYGNRKILQRSGDLYKELTSKAHPKHFEIIRVGKMARIEIGGSSAKFLENQQGRTDKNLPARPMIPGTGGTQFAARDRIEIRRIIQRAIRERTK